MGSLLLPASGELDFHSLTSNLFLICKTPITAGHTMNRPVFSGGLLLTPGGLLTQVSFFQLFCVVLLSARVFNGGSTVCFVMVWLDYETKDNVTNIFVVL